MAGGRKEARVRTAGKAAAPAAVSAAAKTEWAALKRSFPVAFGLFLGLSLLKFGNPPIMEKWVANPKDMTEFILAFPWPIGWAYALLLLVTLGALPLLKRGKVPVLLLIIPGAWLLWVMLSAGYSVDSNLSRLTVRHLIACVVCFYLGCLVLREAVLSRAFLFPLLAAFILVTLSAWEQHFGGLQETRRYFFLYLYPQIKEIPPEYLKKLNSARVFGTLFYPNALAGLIVLCLPALLLLVWRASERRFTPSARGLLVALLAAGGLGALVWSGSKGGWLLMLFSILMIILRLPFSRKLKLAIVSLVLLAGLSGFFLQYAGYFRKGATSASARLDYWRAAWYTTLHHPWFGTGPGTFAIPYARLKAPDSEMSRIVHNDYLEQASDSGIPAMVLYTGFVALAVLISARAFWHTQIETGAAGHVSPRASPFEARTDWQLFALWIGVLSFALQGFFEFGLYIPACSWTACAFLGALVALASDRA
jgi:O-antigen ligase